jgi:hypothetical protein
MKLTTRSDPGANTTPFHYLVKHSTTSHDANNIKITTRSDPGADATPFHYLVKHSTTSHDAKK